MRLLFLPLLLLLAGCARPAADSAPLVYDEGDIVLEAVTAEALLELVRAEDADVVVVNFWASWCLPCREEFPDLMRYDREHADAVVRFVSLDFAEDVSFAVDFLRQQGFSGTTFLKTERDGPFVDAISPAWTGALPATAVYGRDGTRIAFWEGKVTYDELAARVDAARSAS